MTWFKVDDKLHSHIKTAKATVEDVAPMGLWVLAGAWTSEQGLDGFVPLIVLAKLDRSWRKHSRKLVDAGFWSWVEVDGQKGIQFHQFLEDSDGTKRNPSRSEVEEKRRKRAEAGQKGGISSGVTRRRGRSKGEANASSLLEEKRSKNEASGVEPPTRPDPPPKGGRGGGACFQRPTPR